jgi:8-oxo-dGTP pyrophosphatase MutT (NUDIX family)
VRTVDRETLQRLAARLQSRPAGEIRPDRHRRACIIAPFVETPRGWGLLFCRRSEDLRTHSGQMAFPGGAWHEGESLIGAATRETEEEVGVPADAIEIIGRLDDLVTISNYIVAPFVGVIPPGFDYVLQESEVKEVYEVPLEALLRPENPEIRYVEYKGRRYPSYFYHHDGPVIWGLTGRMTKALLDELRAVM